MDVTMTFTTECNGFALTCNHQFFPRSFSFEFSEFTHMVHYQIFFCAVDTN